MRIFNGSHFEVWYNPLIAWNAKKLTWLIITYPEAMQNEYQDTFHTGIVNKSLLQFQTHDG